MIREKEITFVVTKDCQLACKYCYQVGKNAEERMSFETARNAVDYILAHSEDRILQSESVIFDYIGGEPFLEIDLIDSISEYIKESLAKLKHKWSESYAFSITTNGINYDSPKVQKYINRNIGHLHITITIDGTRRKHNLNRVWKNSARGSYDDVVRSIPLWLKQFPNAATKVTISSEDIPYISESVLHLFSLGIKNVRINCVFENVWHDGDDVLFENQLRALADKMLQRGLYNSYQCSFFDRRLGYPMNPSEDSNWCGAGIMLAVDAKGFFYPCIRFAKYSLREKEPRIIGNVHKGIDANKVRPFYALSRSIQSPQECLDCKVASGCAWCQGENYDCSSSGTIFKRSMSLCKMHKARVRANKYFWTKVDELEGKKHPNSPIRIQNRFTIDKTVTCPETLIVMLASDAARFCLSVNPDKEASLHSQNYCVMPLDILRRIIEDAKRGRWNLQFMYPEYELSRDYDDLINSIPHHDIVPSRLGRKGDAVLVNSWNSKLLDSVRGDFLIIRTSLKDFYDNVTSIETLLEHTNRLNLVFKDEINFSTSDEGLYKKALEQLSTFVVKHWKGGHQVKVNVLTDRLQLNSMSNCDAGWKSITLAPNGRFYICPAFYDADETDDCGSLDTGLDIKDSLLYKLDHAPLCRNCNAYQCQRCVFLNKQKTLEVNVPSIEQCKKAEIELEATKLLYYKLF